MMKIAAAALLTLALLAPRAAHADLAAEVEQVATQHHRAPATLGALRDRLERELPAEPRLEPLLYLARLWFITGDRAETPEAQRAAYDRARDLGRRALAIDPKSAAAQFWYTASTARWGATFGVMKSLNLLGEVRRGVATVLELDPKFTRGYALAGNVAFEVPPLLGGSVTAAEEMFRKGLAIDPRFTSMRLGLAKSLLRQGRVDEAQGELQRILAETAPTNEADWTLEDLPSARKLLDAIAARSQARR